MACYDKDLAGCGEFTVHCRDSGLLYVCVAWQVGIMNALMAVTAVIAGAVGIWGSVLGCKVTCCAGQTTGVRILQQFVVLAC